MKTDISKSISDHNSVNVLLNQSMKRTLLDCKLIHLFQSDLILSQNLFSSSDSETTECVLMLTCTSQTSVNQHS